MNIIFSVFIRDLKPYKSIIFSKVPRLQPTDSPRRTTLLCTTAPRRIFSLMKTPYFTGNCSRRNLSSRLLRKINCDTRGAVRFAQPKTLDKPPKSRFALQIDGRDPKDVYARVYTCNSVIRPRPLKCFCIRILLFLIK